MCQHERLLGFHVSSVSVFSELSTLFKFLSCALLDRSYRVYFQIKPKRQKELNLLDIHLNSYNGPYKEPDIRSANHHWVHQTFRLHLHLNQYFQHDFNILHYVRATFRGNCAGTPADSVPGWQMSGRFTHQWSGIHWRPPQVLPGLYLGKCVCRMCPLLPSHTSAELDSSQDETQRVLSPVLQIIFMPCWLWLMFVYSTQRFPGPVMVHKWSDRFIASLNGDVRQQITNK